MVLPGKGKVKKMNPAMFYIRMNMVEMEPMTLHQFDDFKNREHTGENADGYKITYADGYVSWCPKAVSEKVSIPCGDNRGLPFGYAIAMCQYNGKKIKRAGWNGDGQYVRYEEVLAFEDGKPHLEEQNPGVGVESRCFVFHFKNRHTGETGIQVGWLASQGDMKANDWVVLED